MTPSRTSPPSEPFLAVAERLAAEEGLEGLHLIRDGMNHVLGADHAGVEVILRVTDGEHRSHGEVAAEVDWLDFLAARGCRVCRPRPDRQGRLLRTESQDGREFHCVVFEKMEGEVVTPGSPAWGPALHEAWGRALGRIHRVTGEYRPRTSGRRPDWKEMSELSDLGRYRGRLPDAVLDRIEQSLADLRTRPTGAGYGLIHNDAKLDNFFVRDGHVDLLDFDESCECWQIQDLLVPLYFYYAYPRGRVPGSTAADAADFLAAMLAGYRQEHRLPPEQFALAPELLRMREVLIYLVIAGDYDHWHVLMDLHPLTCGHDETIAIIERRLQDGAPTLDLDFARFAEG